MIKFELFKQILDEAKRYQNLSDKMYEYTSGGLDLFRLYEAENGKYTPELFLVSVLENICKDEYGAIGSWAFECKFGEDTLEIGKGEDIIAINTIEELYDFVSNSLKV